MSDEQYRDDLNLLAKHQVPLLHNLDILDQYAPQYGVTYDILKEHYLALGYDRQKGGWRSTTLSQQP